MIQTLLNINPALNITISVLLLIISYLLGSIPFGVIIGKKLKGIDIREHGSKNIGSTNAIRVLGKKIGFLVFFCDVFKWMAIIILVKVLSATGLWVTPIEELYYGAAAIIGHSYSIFLDFKGGKAVATSLGVVLILSPLVAILCLIAFYIALKITGYVSVASTCATITVVSGGWVLFFIGINPTNFLEYFIGKVSLPLALLFSLMGLLIIIKHIKNYKRLINGTENSFKKKKETN